MKLEAKLAKPPLLALLPAYDSIEKGGISKGETC